MASLDPERAAPACGLASPALAAAGPDDEGSTETPRLRGVLHAWAFFGSLISGLALVLTTRADTFWPALVYVLSVTGLFGTSALYHRVKWSPEGYARMRRVDHAMIFVLILGTYTPLFTVALAGRGKEALFLAVCSVAALGVAMTMFWTTAPKWVRAAVYLTVGWMGVLIGPDLLETVGLSGVGVLLLGGALYSLGALIYAVRRPNPIPRIFGYHEVFHGLTIAAAAAHFSLVAFWVLP